MDMEKDSSSTLGPMDQEYKDFIKRYKVGLSLEYAEPPDASSSKGPTRQNFFKRPYLMRIPVATNNKYGFEISLHVPRYKPEDITVRTSADNHIIIEGKREEMKEDVFETMKFTRRYLIPDGIDPETLTCTFIDGLLHIIAPRKFKLSDRTLPITVLE